MFFRASLFGAFGSSKRWLATNPDGTTRPLEMLDFYKAGAMTGFVAAFTEGPIDFYKSQIQVGWRGALGLAGRAGVGIAALCGFVCCSWSMLAKFACLQISARWRLLGAERVLGCRVRVW